MDRKTVLIIDDEPDLVESLKFRLELEGIRCIEAFDGLEGLAKAKKEKPDVILLDVMLPKINGYRIVRGLKSDESYKSIRIIMLSARGDDEEVAFGVQSGADEYVTKPFEMDTLVGLVKRYLNE